MNITKKIDVDQYLDNKGKLHRNETIYDSKYDFYGHFAGYDINTTPINVLVKRFDGVIVSCKPYEIKVEIEYSPIYVAV